MDSSYETLKSEKEFKIRLKSNLFEVHMYSVGELIARHWDQYIIVYNYVLAKKMLSAVSVFDMWFFKYIYILYT